MHPLMVKAVAETAAVVRGVKPDQMSAPTPCRDWDVRVLANHLLQVAVALRLAGRGEAVPGGLWADDLLTGDWAARFEDETRQAIAAWAEPSAWDGVVDMGGSAMPAGLAATMLVSDLVIHGWDLARATGQDYRCDDDVAELAYRFVAQTGEQGRAMGIYAEPVPVADDASMLERAVAISGRNPSR
ncbi:TIGR03086 family metal-binding protein [Allorhizocola rhizosphaerae]|uniref:TIGR03086 family metal-binding protein n=1 Tax=Allorhizocola rhizosphaerae TaxID=1872709 RepID=UPI000E3E88AD|nr:TIGR03086 family metal-binding protein [Allorhizocola rhizosphaerae]